MPRSISPSVVLFQLLALVVLLLLAPVHAFQAQSEYICECTSPICEPADLRLVLPAEKLTSDIKIQMHQKYRTAAVGEL
jgi:hypothetical protein